MKSVKIIALIVFLFIGSGLDAQLNRGAEEGPLKLQSIPVGGLFDHSLLLDMSDDANDVIWVLSATSLYYVVNEGVFEYEIEKDLDADNIHFIRSKTDDSLRYIS